MNEKTVWESYTEEDKKKVYDFCEEYRTFLSKCKTERECVKEILKEAEAKGYRSLKEVRRSGKKLQAGDKVYVSIMGKTLALFHIGKEPMEKGMNILGAHIDSPRLDLKQNPLYESDGLAMLETHYYGGIKKYQSANYNGLSIAGFSLSCAAIIFNFLFGLPGIVGLILSIVGLCQCNKRSEKGRGLAIAGIAIGAVLTLLMILTYAGLILAFDNAFDNAWNSGPRYY